jgi:hypothetical protein
VAAIDSTHTSSVRTFHSVFKAGSFALSSPTRSIWTSADLTDGAWAWERSRAETVGVYDETT